jgi:nitrate reductase NapE component
MTLTDDRTGYAIDARSRDDAQHRHPRPRTVLIALAAVALLVILAALVVGGGGSSNGKATSTVNGPAQIGAAQVPAGGGTAGTSGSAGAAGTSGSAGGTVEFGGGATSLGNRAAIAAPAGGSAPGVAAPPPSAPKAPALPVDTFTKVIKTGDIDLQVAKHQVPHTVDKLIALAKLESGYVSDSHSEDGPSPSGSVTLRVPVQLFEATVAEVRTQIGGKVLDQQTAGQDVTNKYVDLQARVHSLSVTRTTYERLLSHANTIGDILAVQSRISDLQTQIEQLQGQLRVLNDQTSFGTLTVTVSEVGTVTKVAAVHHQSGMSKAFHRSLNRFVNGIEAIVGIIGPLLLVALIGGLGYLVFRALYRRFGPSAPSAAGVGPVGDDRLVGEQ